MTNHKLIASGTNGATQIFLDRWDYETYTVSIHHVGQEATHEDFDNMTFACISFFKACDKNGIKPQKHC